jgi:hypothetical protein
MASIWTDGTTPSGAALLKALPTTTKSGAALTGPQDHPLSQEEIDRMRLGNGIPKEGLL